MVHVTSCTPNPIKIASLLGQKLADSRATVMKFAWLDPHDSNPEASFQGNSEN